MIALINNFPDVRHVEPWSFLIQFIHLFDFRELMLPMRHFVIFLHILFMNVILISLSFFHTLINDTKFGKMNLGIFSK